MEFVIISFNFVKNHEKVKIELREDLEFCSG